MLRRALLIAALLAPAAGRGQEIFSLPPQPFSRAECESSTFYMRLQWSLASTTVIPTGATYRILANTSATCAKSTVRNNVVVDGLAATTVTTVYYPDVGVNALTLNQIAAAAEVTVDCSSSPTFYVCAELVRNDTDKTQVATSGTVKLQVESWPPPAPIISRVTAGDSALTASWTDGTDNKVTPTKYEVYVRDTGCAPAPDTTGCTDPVEHKYSTTQKSLRLEGLMVGVEYGVRVVAISGTAQISPDSAQVNGTPIDVLDFWERYQEAGGVEQGGCAGGPAGLLSLLAVAGLLSAARRRS